MESREGSPARGGPVEPRRGLRRAGVRLCFAAVLAWWLAQGFLLGTGVGEPYPSVLMPRFARTSGYDGGRVSLERMEAAFVGPAGETVVSTRSLLEPISDSHHGTIARLLAPTPPETTRVREWLRHHVFPGLRAPRLVNDPCVDASLQRWLRRRAAAAGHGGPLARVEFRWYRDTVRPSSPGPAQRQPAGVVVVPLAREAACAR